MAFAFLLDVKLPRETASRFFFLWAAGGGRGDIAAADEQRTTSVLRRFGVAATDDCILSIAKAGSVDCTSP
eukprot:4886669-Pleurochrysis_carterae.AAC.1